ncbi:MAG: translesion DNA synthesis-associated protein ImuA [Comamonas sp.]
MPHHHATSPAAQAHARLPPSVAAAVWPGAGMAQSRISAIPTGWPALDQALPGGGWPTHGLTELLPQQWGTVEWRLIAHALQAGSPDLPIAVLGAPHPPHASGLAQSGIAARQLVWVNPACAADLLWATEQLISANAAGAVVAWLREARPEQIRRLQIAAHRFDGLVFLVRPALACHAATAAPLRLQVAHAPDWALQVRILKRRGPALDEALRLPAVPPALAGLLTPRMRHYSGRLAPPDTFPRKVPHAVPALGSPAPATAEPAWH